MQKLNVKNVFRCHHCGKKCDSQISSEGKYFCSKRCKGMNEVLTSYSKEVTDSGDSVEHSTEDLNKNNGASKKSKFKLNFESDYRSYFPSVVTVKKKYCQQSIPTSKVRSGDRIIIHNNEVVPVDAMLFSGTSNIDYSFVTGKSAPEQKGPGEILYAGGRHSGGDIELEVIRTASQSELTKLWNGGTSKKRIDLKYWNQSNFVFKYFQITLLLIVIISALYWIPRDIDLAINSFITGLIVSLPFLILLTGLFSHRNTLRIFRKNKLYPKSELIIEKLSKIGSIVFDKTGTITSVKDSTIKFAGDELSPEELSLIKSLVRNSSHPLSKKIYDSISADVYLDVEDFSESMSKGISGSMYGDEIRMGSPRFIMKDLYCSYYDFKHESGRNNFSTHVFLSINHYIKGYFSFNNKYREGLDVVINDLSGQYSLSVISGDNNSEMSNLKKYFKDDNDLLFDRSYNDKLNYIKMLQQKGKKVLMIVDGLNDAAALEQSDAGITVSEDISNFSPSCDATIEASEFSKLGKLIKFSKSAMNVTKISFSILMLYSLTGLYFTVPGTLPIPIAVILMILTSFTIFIFESVSIKFLATMNKL